MEQIQKPNEKVIVESHKSETSICSKIQVENLETTTTSPPARAAPVNLAGDGASPLLVKNAG